MREVPENEEGEKYDDRNGMDPLVCWWRWCSRLRNWNLALGSTRVAGTAKDGKINCIIHVARFFLSMRLERNRGFIRFSFWCAYFLRWVNLYMSFVSGYRLFSSSSLSTTLGGKCIRIATRYAHDFGLWWDFLLLLGKRTFNPQCLGKVIKNFSTFQKRFITPFC